MKKFIVGILIVGMMAALTACGSSSKGGPLPAQEVEEGSDYVEISFHYEKQSGLGSNQFAVWIEDENGDVVRTLYATYFIANGGYTRRPEAIPTWVEKSGVKSMETDEVDAITGATPDTSDLSFLWDLTDQDGNSVEPGEYTYYVEGTMYMSNRFLFTGVIDTSGDEVTTTASAEYIYEGDSEKDTLSEESSQNSMITDVTASYVIHSN
ncbi:MAG: DUF2271 domain-containing protein [Lachnospiraceae bacterium]|nr:DUF2271 domain-containing protein [Lachnospiraceae bacterium]